MDNNKIFHITDENFKENILKKSEFILVDFWAEWCQPCKIISPILDEIANEHNKKIKIGKLNIENNPKITSKYKIKSIPTLLLFKSGNIIDKKIGIFSKKELLNFLSKTIKL